MKKKKIEFTFTSILVIDIFYFVVVLLIWNIFDWNYKFPAAFIITAIMTIVMVLYKRKQSGANRNKNNSENV